MSSQLIGLNPHLRVIQYNGGPILGQYGVSNAFHMAPGAPSRATATRAGTTFDIVLEYTNPNTNNTFNLAHLLVISPKFDEVTAMLKAGVVWVHDAASPYLSNTPSKDSPENVSTLDISYSQHFMTFHKDKTIPNEKLPIPCAVFNYGDEKAPLTIASVDHTIAPAVKSGQYIHIKFTETFDDDYNIDFGHFFLIGSTSPQPPNNQIATPSIPSYPNTLALEHRSFLLQHKYISLPSTLSTQNELLSLKNSESFFSQTSAVFISSKPIHQYLSYIEGVGDVKELTTPEQELVTAFIQYNHASEIFTKSWRKSFTADLITANLQKETGTGMVKGNKASSGAPGAGSSTKQLEYCSELTFFTMDPTTPREIRNVALGHLGELEAIQLDENPDQQFELKLSSGKLFTILACSPSGACQKYEYQATDHDEGVVCAALKGEMAKASLASKITEFLNTLATSSSNNTTGLNMFLARVSILSSFLFEFYEQQESEQTKKTSAVAAAPKKIAAGTKGKTTAKKELLYSIIQRDFFRGLLKQRILSQQSEESIASSGVDVHPIYNKVQFSSYHGLHSELQQAIADKQLTEPKAILIMPVDKTTESHLEIVATLLEFSNILNEFQNGKEYTGSDGQKVTKRLSSIQIGLFDVLLNNVNDCLFSFSKFLNSARLFIVVPKSPLHTDGALEFKPTPTPTQKTGTPTAKKAALGKVAPPVKKFTLPLVNITSYMPPEFPTPHVVNDIYAVDLVFDKMIDQSMVELAMQTEEETPPPTLIEFVNYLIKVQAFLKTALNLPSTWSIVPPAADTTPFAQHFGKSIGSLNTLIDDISYLRLLHSTIVNSFYSRFIIQEDKNTFDQFDGDVRRYAELDGEKMNLVDFPKDSNEEKLMAALRGFTKRAEILLERLPQPIGLCPIPFTSLSGLFPQQAIVRDDVQKKVVALLPKEVIQDWDGDGSKVIPQLMTLTTQTQHTRQYIASFTAQSDLKPDQIISIREKLTLVRQGTDNTINLINDRVRVMIGMRDCLLQISRHIQHFPQFVLDLCSKNTTNTALLTFFTYLQASYYNTGLVYTLQQLNQSNAPILAQINSALKITVPTQIDTSVKPMMDFANLFNPDCAKPSPKFAHGDINLTLSPPPSMSLNEAITTTSDLFNTTISVAIQSKLSTTFAQLAKTDNFITLQNETQFQRCLEGYTILEPQITAPSTSKSSFSRAAVTKAVSAAKESVNNNKKWDDADDRIIVLWLTHNLDGCFSHIDELQTVFNGLVDKYQTYSEQIDGEQSSKHQNIVLARIDVEQFPEVVEQFALDPASSLPALLFVQSCAERADLRSTGIAPKELSQLLTDGLVNIIENPELYGVGGLDEEDEFTTDAEDDLPE